MTPEIMLYSGSYFNFLNPEQSNLTIDDIAHGLSHINRFTGHSEKPYSVAEHCVRGSYEISEHLALDFLMHDASESVLGDVSTPLKMLLPDYKTVEKCVERAIANRFGTEFPMSPEVKIVDTRMLATEVFHLMPRECQNWDCLQGVEKYAFTIEPWSAKVAKQMFLNRYYELLSKRKVH
jgi:5'-deoxynucleotidase YfbR-like HD superfamily hydrolase